MRGMRRIGSLVAIAVSVALLGSPAPANVGEVSKEAVVTKVELAPEGVLRISAQRSEFDQNPGNSGELSECDESVICEG
jgi:hypothetical protein